jgi:DNA polymerase-3 subunit alpha
MPTGSFSIPISSISNPRGDEGYFAEYPGAIENTVAIAERCYIEFDFKPTISPVRCRFGKTCRRAVRGAGARRLRTPHGRCAGKNPDLDETVYRERLEYELKTIKEMGFPGYFLIVADFIRYAKENGIPGGTRRGSAAGSLVSYALSITDLDPIEHGLIFERFLNPARISMPDIDVDFASTAGKKCTTTWSSATAAGTTWPRSSPSAR